MSSQIRSPTYQGVTAHGYGRSGEPVKTIHTKSKRRMAQEKPKQIPYYQKKVKNDQRRIIQKPWSKPMAAQHLAAIKIQKAMKRFLYLKHRGDKKYMQRRVQNKKQNQLQASKGGFPQHFTSTQKLRSKFLTSPYNVIHRNEDQCWTNFCAALIQATFKMALTQRLFRYHRFAMYHIAAIQIQWAWRGFLERAKKTPQKSKEELAIEKIQRAWRSFTNVKIFNYKDLINFKQKGDPAQLLKSVNPSEAGILDAATKCHIRFRLGGDKFPPLIYYKIFSHGSIVDVNAFAPRDYMEMKKKKKKQCINVALDKGRDDKFDGWYQRIENNGWRPISDKILTPYDAVELRTANQPKQFHFNKAKRAELTAKQKRQKKLKWLRKLYKDAKNAEMAADEESAEKTDDPGNYENPFDDKRFMELGDGDFNVEVNNLIEWCEDLDYEKYIGNWNKLATSAYTGSGPAPGMDPAAGITAGNMDLMGDEMDMQVQQQALNEEQFLRQNVDYEQKLQSHLYQFQDGPSGIPMQKYASPDSKAGGTSAISGGPLSEGPSAILKPDPK